MEQSSVTSSASLSWIIEARSGGVGRRKRSWGQRSRELRGQGGSSRTKLAGRGLWVE